MKGRGDYNSRELKIKIPGRFIGDDKDRFYVEGNINCNGEGSITLDKNNSFTHKMTLRPGKYGYNVFRNQYQRIEDLKSEFTVKVKRNFHDPSIGGFQYTSNGVTIVFTETEKGKRCKIDVCHGKVINQGTIKREWGSVNYFIIQGCDEYSFKCGEERLPGDGYFMVKNRNVDEGGTGIIYQIFPDRFFRSGDKASGNFSMWGYPPEYWNFYGGDLKGIQEKVDYIKKMNAEYVYLNPVFKSHSNHRYDVDDYLRVDEVLGNKKDLRGLIDSIHSLRMKFMMDMVFNHTSIHNRIFRDVLRNGKDSRYYGWYIFHQDDFKTFPGRCDFLKGEMECPPYETFMGYGGMPKLDLRNEEVRNYISNVVNYWVKRFKIDAMRYDVGNSLDPLLIKRLKNEHPDLLHIGEVWCSSPYLTEDGLYDGLINYELRDWIIKYFNERISARTLLERYYEQVFRMGYGIEKQMNLLGSHDTERILNSLKGEREKVLSAYALLLMFNGLPIIYYGDEVSLEGGKDPDCRRTFPWERVGSRFHRMFLSITELRGKERLMRNGLLAMETGKGYDIFKKIGGDEVLKLIIAHRDIVLKVEGDYLMRKGCRMRKGKIFMRKGGFFFSKTKLS